ncbi:MAG: TldD/PmbA family protein [Candidatus Hodarchaeota archaeon]
MNDSDILFDIASFAIKRAKSAGMDGSFVNAGLNHVISTRFANSAIHQNFTDSETNIEITVIKGLKKASASTNLLEKSSVSWAVDQASKIIKHLPDDPEFPGVLTEPQTYPQLRLNDPKAKNITASDVSDLIISGINAGHEYSKKVQTVSGNLNFKDGFTLFLSSEDHEYTAPTTEISSTINIMADDGTAESRSNSNFGERKFSKLPFESEAIEVAKRSVMGLNSTEIESKEYPVILDYQAAADQIFWLGYSFSAKMILEQRSFLRDKVGEQIFDDSMTMINDPLDPSSLTARALDMEGVASQKFTLIDQGVVRNFAHSRLTAHKMGTKSNGCGFIFYGETFPIPFALKIQPGVRKRQKLIEETDYGLLVTNLHYTNFIDSPRGTITGMTKDGVFIVKNGEIIGAAKNMRFTDSVPKMFSTVELSEEMLQVLTLFGIGFSVPAMKIDSMMFSSKTTH